MGVDDSAVFSTAGPHATTTFAPPSFGLVLAPGWDPPHYRSALSCLVGASDPICDVICSRDAMYVIKYNCRENHSGAGLCRHGCGAIQLPQKPTTLTLVPPKA